MPQAIAADLSGKTCIVSGANTGIGKQIAGELAANQATILAELIDAQGPATDVGGYYQPDPALADKAMRPSGTFNAILEGALAETV